MNPAVINKVAPEVALQGYCVYVAKCMKGSFDSHKRLFMTTESDEMYTNETFTLLLATFPHPLLLLMLLCV